MKKCELCHSVARMYCESDQATLCWDCDSRVHSANFLVSKHSRILLCRSCQSLTPWTASGPKLAPTLSICQSCVGTNSNSVHGDPNHENDNDDDEDEDEDEDEDDDDDDDDDDGDNQVVPLRTNFPTGPGTASSSSSSEYSPSGGYIQGRERSRSFENSLASTRSTYNSSFTSNNQGRNQGSGGQKSSSWKWR